MTRVAYLVAGAGGMYCGTCLRDNRVAATLLELGHDVVLLPLYTPIRTDESSVSHPQVYYGGVNVYLEQVIPAFSRLPRFAQDLFNSNMLLRAMGRFASGTRPKTMGRLTVSILQGPQGCQRVEMEKLSELLASLHADVIHLPNLMFAGIAQHLKETLGAAVTCSLAGEDVFIDALPQPYREQAIGLIKQSANSIDGFIAPTAYYGRYGAVRFGLDPARIHHVPMGIKPPSDGPMELTRQNKALTIGYLARICPEKGLHNLVDAVSTLAKRGEYTHLRIAGYLGRADRRYFRNVRKTIEQSRIAHMVDYCGELSRQEKWAFLSSVDLFSVPTDYHESKGLYVLEAMACGTPVIQPNHGSFPELIEDCRGGLVYDPTEPDALADAILSLKADVAHRLELAANGRQSVRSRYNDVEMARHTWNVFDTLSKQSSRSLV